MSEGGLHVTQAFGRCSLQCTTSAMQPGVGHLHGLPANAQTRPVEQQVQLGPHPSCQPAAAVAAPPVGSATAQRAPLEEGSAARTVCPRRQSCRRCSCRAPLRPGCCPRIVREPWPPVAGMAGCPSQRCCHAAACWRAGRHAWPRGTQLVLRECLKLQPAPPRLASSAAIPCACVAPRPPRLPGVRAQRSASAGCWAALRWCLRPCGRQCSMRRK